MAGRAGAKRPTITEIARLTGVSPGAVSFALNGRPGVSEETRARILGVAREIGWVPSTAARALRGGGTATIGLVITREPAMLGVEPFFMRFVAGIEQAITDRGMRSCFRSHRISSARSRPIATGGRRDGSTASS